MPLNKNSLKDGVVRIVDELSSSKLEFPKGKVSLEAAQKWAQTYHEYAQQAIAGPVTPNPGTMQPALIQAKMLASAGNFAAGLAAGLEAYWQAVMFVGSGFIPSNPCTPGTFAAAKVQGAIASLPLKKSRSEGAAQIANALHTYTTGIQVTTTTTSAPPVVVTTVPVT